MRLSFVCDGEGPTEAGRVERAGQLERGQRKQGRWRVTDRNGAGGESGTFTEGPTEAIGWRGTHGSGAGGEEPAEARRVVRGRQKRGGWRERDGWRG